MTIRRKSTGIFRVWLIDDERMPMKRIPELSQLWKATESATTPNYQHSLERMRTHRNKDETKSTYLHTRLVIWKIAAALLIAVSAGSIYLALQNRQAPDLLQAYIPTTEMQNITLPDGTQVMINSEKYLAYILNSLRGRQSLCLSGGRPTSR